MTTMQISTTRLRVMKPSDLAAAIELSTIAGWNQTAEDWRMLIDLAPAGCFAIESEGQLVSTTTLMRYGHRLAWIGMVLTKPEYRGRGFAHKLLERALDYADSLEIETVKLDATDQGKPLYESLGFHAEQSVERWTRPGTSNPTSFRNSSLVNEYVSDLDSDAFGADRSLVLTQLAARSELTTEFDAFLFTRAGRTTAYLGPCVAFNPATARALITSATNASPQANWSWDLLQSNQRAVALASELGFTSQRILTRMARGKVLRGRDDMIYAIAGFELG